MKPAFFSVFVCTVTLTCMLSAPARAAGITYDGGAAYQSMADAASAQTVKEGTTVTLQNWQQYQQFMSAGVRAAFSQSYPWKVGSDPRYTIVVGPTISVPMFQQLRKNTEQYAGQTKLVKISSGGYTIKGYVAGVPFPKPSGSEKAYQVVYNTWTNYFPSMSYFDDTSNNIDRFRNNFFQADDVDQWRLSHSSDEGFPIDAPSGKGILQASRFFVYTPEQTKYTTQLAQLPDDPEGLQEVFVFLPSLRRSLRLSTAARCSPILGSDFLQDDNGDGIFFQVPNFSVKILGEKKVLALFHADKAHYYSGNKAGGEKYFDRAGLPGWPSPEVGKWEVRNAYVLDVAPLPAMSPGYCYPHKIIFVDTETFVQLFLDMYDQSGKLWKSELIWYRPIAVNDHENYIVHAQDDEVMLDWENTHATTSLPNAEPQLNKLCQHAITKDPATYAFPGGLANVMR